MAILLCIYQHDLWIKDKDIDGVMSQALFNFQGRRKLKKMLCVLSVKEMRVKKGVMEEGSGCTSGRGYYSPDLRPLTWRLFNQQLRHK